MVPPGESAVFGVEELEEHVMPTALRRNR